MGAALEPAPLNLPVSNETLYVEKPIGKYEPTQAQDSKKKRHEKVDDSRLIRKKFNSEPKTQAEQTDCKQELTGEQLQKIIAGPKEIDFKEVFVKSKNTKSFTVTNELRQYIHVGLRIPYPELAESFPQSQVIPPGQKAGFDIKFSSNRKQNFVQPIQYQINKKDPPFEFLVKAKVEPVTLEVSKQKLEFRFSDDNTDMSISEQVILTNRGNATARFQWDFPEGSLYVPEPASGEVEPGRHKTCKITFTPTGPRNEEKILPLKITDGATINVMCRGVVDEAKCKIVEKQVDFGNVAVGIEPKEQMIHIQNLIKKPAVFHIISDYEELKITPMRGRIMNDRSETLKVGFLSNKEKPFEGKIHVKIRGGDVLPLTVLANAIIPDVRIEEEVFDFGGVTFGDSKVLPLTIHNDSNIEALLILDMRQYGEEFAVSLAQEMEIDDVASEIMVPVPEE